MCVCTEVDYSDKVLRIKLVRHSMNFNIMTG